MNPCGLVPVPGQGVRHAQPPAEPTCPWCGYTGRFSPADKPPCHPPGEYAICYECGYTDAREAFGLKED